MPENERQLARLRAQKAAYMRRRRLSEYSSPERLGSLPRFWLRVLGEDLRERLIQEVHDELSGGGGVGA